jgi:hypothetical protein
LQLFIIYHPRGLPLQTCEQTKLLKYKVREVINDSSSSSSPLAFCTQPNTKKVARRKIKSPHPSQQQQHALI